MEYTVLLLIVKMEQFVGVISSIGKVTMDVRSVRGYRTLEKRRVQHRVWV